LLDAGASQVKGGGLISKGLKLPAGQVPVGFNEWITVDSIGGIADHVFPLPKPEVSPVIFELYNAILNGAKELANLNDAITDPSKISGNASVPLIMAMMEGRTEVFGANYKRIYRGFTKEFRLLFALNEKHIDDNFDFYNLLDAPEQVAQVMAGDYNSQDLAIYPVGDPTLITSAAKTSQTLALAQMSGRTGVNEYELTKLMFERVDAEAAKKLVMTQEEIAAQQQNAPPDPLTIAAETERIKVQSQIQLEALKQMLATQTAEYQNAKTISETIKNLAQAESLEAGPQLEMYQQELGFILEGIKQRNALIQAQMRGANGNTGANAGMEAPPGNGMVSGNAGGETPGAFSRSDEPPGAGGEFIANGQGY
jgi:hypothetical protein